MSKEIIGTFYFRRTSYGNLIGEFANNTNEVIITESALPKQLTFDYAGDYESVWFDEKLHNANLSITRLGSKYKLNWSEPNELTYEGEGILVDNILIGYYYNR